MDENHISSFLSKQVRNMVVEIGIPHLKDHSTKCNMYISHRCTFNWEKIETILNVYGGFCIHDQPTSWFIDKIDKLWPIFIEAHSLYSCSPPNLVDMQDLCEWTSHPKEIQEFFNLFQDSDLSTTEAVLFLTAVLERSLGNLFLLKGSNVPSLLRDLLSTTEIEIILGKVPVVFLQILMGTPSALNLRNIAWHGFCREDELYPHFVSTLFTVILSVGELLIERNIEFFTIPKRQQMEFSDDICDIFPNVQKNHQDIFEILFHSDFIPESHLSYWKCALEHYKSKRFGRALLILLPQVEHMLRCLYCRINDCLEQVLTAESITLYTTLNEIMGEKIISEDGVYKENKIIHFLGESVMEMLQDLFLHPAGPRLRDKMSHGECNLKNIPEQLINHLIFAVVAIEIKAEEQLQNKSFKKEVCQIEMINQVQHMYENYVTKFHPTSLLKETIQHCLLSLNLLTINDTQHLNSDINHTILSSERSELSSLIQEIYNSLQKNESYSCIESVSACVVSLKIQTLFRHKSENEIVNLLRQIMGNVEQICEQVVDLVQEKYCLYTQHLLRSRQRETLKRMLCFVPQLKNILFCITCIIVICLQFVNNICSLLGIELENLAKFCRTILQFVQNVVSLTKRDKNRWLEIQKLAENCCQIILKTLNASFFLRISVMR